MSSFVTFLEHLKSGRISDIISAVLRRFPRWLFRYSAGSIFEKQLTSTKANSFSPELPDGYSYRPATENDMAECANEAGGTILQLKNRLIAGDFCQLITTKERIANQMWIHWGDCYIRGAGYYVPAKSNDAYVYAIVTSNAFRGKGLYKKGLELLEQTLREREATRILQFVEKGNEAVLHTLPLIGYERTIDVIHLRILGIGITKTTCCSSLEHSWNFFLRGRKSTYII